MTGTLRRLHNRAMELALQAMLQDAPGCSSRSRALFRAALHLERFVLCCYELLGVDDLTHAVFCRSAATLAVDCELWEEARHWAERGLQNEIPEEIREELREVLALAHMIGCKTPTINPGSVVGATSESRSTDCPGSTPGIPTTGS